MKLWIDNHCVEAEPGQTLLDLIRELGLDDPRLSAVRWRRRSPVKSLP